MSLMQSRPGIWFLGGFIFLYMWCWRMSSEVVGVLACQAKAVLGYQLHVLLSPGQRNVYLSSKSHDKKTTNLITWSTTLQKPQISYLKVKTTKNTNFILEGPHYKNHKLHTWRFKLQKLQTSYLKAHTIKVANFILEGPHYKNHKLHNWKPTP